MQYISIHSKGEKHFKRINQSPLRNIAQDEKVSVGCVIASVAGLVFALISTAFLA